MRLMNFTIDLVTFENLKEEIDYEIVTLMEMDSYGEMLPNTKVSNKMIFQAIEQKLSNQPLVQFINETYQLKLVESKYLHKDMKMYLLTEDMIDFRTATECFYGIVRMKTGDYAGHYFLYDCSDFAYFDDDMFEEELFDYRGLLLDVYLEIASPYYHNPTLENILYSAEFEPLLEEIMLRKVTYLVNRLEMAIQLKKNRSNNIIQFKK